MILRDKVRTWLMGTLPSNMAGKQYDDDDDDDDDDNNNNNIDNLVFWIIPVTY
jgi:hypothetical protein